MPVDRVAPRPLHRLVELIALLRAYGGGTTGRLRTGPQRSCFAAAVRPAVLATALLGIGGLVSLVLLGTLVAHTF